MNARLQESDGKWYYYLVISNENISDAVVKRGRIVGVIIIIFKTVQYGATIWNSRTYRNSRVV